MKITELVLMNTSVDMYDDTFISFTYQVNDISEVKDRQASFTDSFSIPKTSKNVSLLKGLGIASDTSDIPYTKPDCRLKLEGFDLIFNGWFNVTETTDEYKVFIYSGIINFFKAIENKTLGTDLDLSEINHEKDLATVLTSQLNPNFRYLLADYGGKTHYSSENIVNIDYLVPSVNVSFLWRKINTEFGFKFKGSIFESDDFKNLWITYPKGITGEELTLKNLQIGDLSFSNSSAYTFAQGYVGEKFTIPQNGKYRFTLKGDLQGIASGSLLAVPFKVQIWKTSVIIFEYYIYKLGDFEIVANLNLVKDDEIYFYYIWEQPGNYTLTLDYDFRTDLVSGSNYSFNDELKEFQITNFIKEIFNRFALTPFADSTNEIEYLTFSERINTEKIIDWTDKFVDRKSENYTYNSYAQANNFTFKYNDDESTYANGSIFINNVNLKESTTVFASVMYAPEKYYVPFQIGSGEINTLIYKIYEKDIAEKDGEQTITYKGIDKRFMFVKSAPLVATFQIGSEIAIESVEVNSFNTANFAGDWNELLTIYYPDLKKILNESRIHNIDLILNDVDILQLDFRPIYYFAQEQQYYLLNKIQYSKSNKTGEFIRINKSASTINPPEPITVEIVISWMDDTQVPLVGEAEEIEMKILSIVGEENIDSLEWQRLIFDWEDLGTGITPFTSPLEIGVNRFRIKAVTTENQTVYSNILRYERKEPVIYDCKLFEFLYFGNTEAETGTIIYKDCEGVQQTLILYLDGSNGNYTTSICASQLISVSGYAQDITNYSNQQDC